MIKEPPLQSAILTGRFLSNGWATFVSSLYRQAVRSVNGLEESGTTANRPTTDLWVGRQYFDTTLGYPVFVKSLGPTVWVNGAGTTV